MRRPRPNLGYDLPRPPTRASLMGMGAALFALALAAVLLCAALMQRVADWHAPLRDQLADAIAATAPLTPITTSRTSPVVLVIIGDMRAHEWQLPGFTFGDEAAMLPAARWRISSPAQPPDGYLATLLGGSMQRGGMFTADTLVNPALRHQLYTDTLLSLPDVNTYNLLSITEQNGVSYYNNLLPYGAPITSGRYSLVVGSYAGLSRCHYLTPDCADWGSRLEQGVQHLYADVASISGTLVLVGDYGQWGVRDHTYVEGDTLLGGLTNPPPPPLLVAFGPYVQASDYGNARAEDVAPTIAALLGVAPPPLTEGQILWPMLKLPDRAAAIAEYNLAAQRVRLADAYAALWGKVYDDVSARANLQAAAEALRVPDYPSARDLSRTAFAAAAQGANDLRHAQSGGGWGWLLLLLAVGGAIAGLLGWRRRLGYARPILFYVAMAIVALPLEAAVLLLVGQAADLSFITLPRDWLDLTWFEFGGLIVAAVGQVLLGIAVALLYRRAHRGGLAAGPQYAPAAGQIAVWQLRTTLPIPPRVLWQAGYIAALLLAALLVIVAAAMYGVYGFAPDFPPPDAGGTLALLYTLTLLAANALLGTILTPLAALAAYRVFGQR